MSSESGESSVSESDPSFMPGEIKISALAGPPSPWLFRDMEERASVDCGAASGRRSEGEEEKKQGASAWVFVGSLSLLLAGLMALMVCSHGEAPLWLMSELCAVLWLLLYLWAYHLTQGLAAGAVVPVEALVFPFPLVFCADFLAALLAVTAGPIAGALVMVADVACTSGFFGFCLAEYVRYNSLVQHEVWTQAG